MQGELRKTNEFRIYQILGINWAVLLIQSWKGRQGGPGPGQRLISWDDMGSGDSRGLSDSNGCTLSKRCGHLQAHVS